MNGEKNYSKIYTAIWKRQIVIFSIALVLAGLGIFSAFGGNTALLYILFLVALIITIIISFILKCPACNCYICWNSKARGYKTQPYAVVPFDKKCPKCGVILRE